MRRFLHIVLVALLVFGTPAAFGATAPHAAGAKAPLDEGCAGAHPEMVPDLAGTDVQRRMETRIDAGILTGPALGACGAAEVSATASVAAPVAARSTAIYLQHCSLLC